MPKKKMKTCMYDNERCFNLNDRQEEEKEVRPKDVFQGYNKQSNKQSNNSKPKTKNTVATTKNKPKKSSY